MPIFAFEHMTDEERAAAEADYDRAVNSLFDAGWRGQAAASDPFYGMPVNAAMIGAVIKAVAENVPPVEAVVTVKDPPAWKSPTPEAYCNCGYCRGVITHFKGRNASDRPVLGRNV